MKMQDYGAKTSFWLFYPGVGEGFDFLKLARDITERHVYALRVRGFNAGEIPFTCMEEAVMIYQAAIKKVQPIGPYAIAGYSYGTMLAFETAKSLEGNGNKVRFLGSFNLQPHIRDRINWLFW